MSDSKTFSRRDFLKKAASVPIAGISTPPALALLGAILEGKCQEAWAAENELNPRTFINITSAGAPARWMYNNFLNPYDSPKFNPHKMVASNFKTGGSRYTETEYVTHLVKGIHVPTLYTYSVPKPGGYGMMSELLSNMLCVQGIDTRNAGHTGSSIGAFVPTGAKQSAAALSGDPSNAPFAAIDLGSPGFSFRSLVNKTSVRANPAGGLSGLLGLFKPIGSTKYLSEREIFRGALSGYLNMLDELAKSGHKGAQTIIENRESSLDLAETNFVDLNAQWSPLLAKYKDLINRSIFCEENNLLVGINDKPVGSGGGGEIKQYEVDWQNPVGLNQISDFRSIITPETSVLDMAESFALTEYIVLNKLSSSISLNIGNLNDLYNPDNKKKFPMLNDSHTAGIFPHTMISTLRHRAVASCILELITCLKAANLFNDVIIREAGEFNRVPNPTSTGSDHGSTGLSHTFYCGAFNGPLVIGNLGIGSGKDHWGAGGVIPDRGNRRLYLTDAIATLAYLLRVPAPLTSASSVVSLGPQGLASLIGKTEYT